MNRSDLIDYKSLNRKVLLALLFFCIDDIIIVITTSM
jgi:hypothetical protein